jgi:hypothetical protein
MHIFAKWTRYYTALQNIWKLTAYLGKKVVIFFIASFVFRWPKEKKKNNNFQQIQILYIFLDPEKHIFKTIFMFSYNMSWKRVIMHLICFSFLELFLAIFLLRTGPKTMGMWRGGGNCAGNSRAKSGFSQRTVRGSLKETRIQFQSSVFSLCLVIKKFYGSKQVFWIPKFVWLGSLNLFLRIVDFSMYMKLNQFVACCYRWISFLAQALSFDLCKELWEECSEKIITMVLRGSGKSWDIFIPELQQLNWHNIIEDSFTHYITRISPNSPSQIKHNTVLLHGLKKNYLQHSALHNGQYYLFQGPIFNIVASSLKERKKNMQKNSWKRPKTVFAVKLRISVIILAETP